MDDALKMHQDVLFIDICEITIHANFCEKNDNINRIQGVFQVIYIGLRYSLGKV